ncbi:MAG TPA: OmpA family protein [Thermoanaerobaculia bacterium]|jgi:outer membrane protein OmpA-like peptidoglycan-associated protein|nr:OmpA family protein [Thermoanaerobaculia bacterium]
MKRTLKGLSLGILTVALVGCATNKSVDEKINAKIAESESKSNTKIESVAGQVETVQQHQKEQDAQLASLSQEAKDALKRATDAGVLAKGKVAFQQTFGEDRIKFKLNKYELDDAAKAALDEFAGKVKALSDQYYIEIQGHTDDTGGKRYNEDLGERRAEAVRRYLSRSAGLPLMRMSTISYGDTLPVAPNKTRAGRAQNRRVVIVVLE